MATEFPHYLDISNDDYGSVGSAAAENNIPKTTDQCYRENCKAIKDYMGWQGLQELDTDASGTRDPFQTVKSPATGKLSVKFPVDQPAAQGSEATGDNPRLQRRPSSSRGQNSNSQSQSQASAGSRPRGLNRRNFCTHFQEIGQIKYVNGTVDSSCRGQASGILDSGQPGGLSQGCSNPKRRVHFTLGYAHANSSGECITCTARPTGHQTSFKHKFPSLLPLFVPGPHAKQQVEANFRSEYSEPVEVGIGPKNQNRLIDSN